MLTKYQEGQVILIDKPLDWTSFDIVNKIKFTFKKSIPKLKIGHAGTLDPRATGLLIVCTGKFTKRITEIQDQYKVYTGSMYLGATTESYDTEKPVNQEFDTSEIKDEDIIEATKAFTGTITQTPPIHSAVKVQGRKAYDLAREGEAVKLRSREVHIHHFHITKIEMPYVHFEVKCSKGTYIRSLVNDFGQALNNGAYLATLRREQIGDYSVQDAWQIDDLITTIRSEIEQYASI